MTKMREGAAEFPHTPFRRAIVLSQQKKLKADSEINILYYLISKLSFNKGTICFRIISFDISATSPVNCTFRILSNSF